MGALRITAKNAIAPCSGTPEESEVESCEHQDNANIHTQPFPETISEEREIYTDYDGCHSPGGAGLVTGPLKNTSPSVSLVVVRFAAHPLTSLRFADVIFIKVPCHVGC